MANPLFDLLANKNNNFQEMLIQMYKSGGNPMNLVDPQMKQLLNSCNGNYQQLFYELCKQKGVDPNSILNKLK